MIKRLIALTVFVPAILLIALPSLATTTQVAENALLQQATSPAPKANPEPLIIPHEPNLNAKGYVLMDFNSGRIIAEKNMNQRMQPASLTKLMTLYIAAEALSQGQINLDDKVVISRKAWSMGGSRMFLKEGSRVSVRQLIEGIIVASGNDACVALAQYIAGNEASFAQIMNRTAKALGMNASHFVDSTGLPNSNHYTTPYNLALLTRAWIKNFPQYYPWFKQKWIKFNGIKQPNRNRLLWRDPSVDGLKTGHTKAAGYCLITSADRKGMRLISVVMGTPTDAARANDSEALLNWGYRFYTTQKLFSANTAITRPRIWLAQHRRVALGLAQDLYVTVARGEMKNLEAVIKLNPKLAAPIQHGQVYGTLAIILNSKVIEQTPLIALEDDKSGGFFTRIRDHIEMLFKRWF